MAQPHSELSRLGEQWGEEKARLEALVDETLLRLKTVDEG
jgi:hypothetical protein